MKKLLLSLILVLISSFWSFSTALCLPSLSTESMSVITITGSLSLIESPCEDDEEPCLPCLTMVIQTNNILYYLSAEDAVIRIQLDELESQLTEESIVVSLSGTPYTSGSFDYFLVAGIIPYFREGMIWSYLASPMDMDITYYTETEVHGETIVDGICYQNIGEYLVRTIGNKIYVRNDEDAIQEDKPKELLIYDFSLNVGDSIVALYNSELDNQGNRWHKVVEVDNVTLKDEQHTQARRIKYNDGQADIEYIGASNGDFFRSISLLGPEVEMSYVYLCCAVGDELLYEFTPNGCNIQTDVEVVRNSEEPSAKAFKQIRDGQLYIIHNDKTYNASGIEFQQK